MQREDSPRLFQEIHKTAQEARDRDRQLQEKNAQIRKEEEEKEAVRWWLDRTRSGLV